MKKQKTESGVKILIIGIVLVCLVLGYYYYLSNKKTADSEKPSEEISAVQEVLLYNFERNYPPTPKEVVKLYGEMTQCLYGEEYTEEEFVALAMQIQNLYDAELIANKTENQYIEDLRWDINQFKEQEIVISSYAVSSAADVDYFTQDGFEWAKLYCSFTLRQSTQLDVSNEVFLLREDEEGHWKIYGWTLAEEVDDQTDK